MSPLHSLRFASVSALTAFAVTLGACGDTTTAPSQSADQLPDRPASGGSPSQLDTPASGGTKDTSASHKVALAVQTLARVNAPFTAPGGVKIPTPSTFCLGTTRTILVSGMQVSSMYEPTGTAGLNQKVSVEVFLYRWNPTTGWQPVDKRAWVSPDQLNVFYVNWMQVPVASFAPTSAGYYNIQVRVIWNFGAGGFPMGPQALRYFVMNSPADYAAAGGSLVYPNGYCYVH
jgi:hypothetical protein